MIPRLSSTRPCKHRGVNSSSGIKCLGGAERGIDISLAREI